MTDSERRRLPAGARQGRAGERNWPHGRSSSFGAMHRARSRPTRAPVVNNAGSRRPTPLPADRDQTVTRLAGRASRLDHGTDRGGAPALRPEPGGRGVSDSGVLQVVEAAQCLKGMPPNACEPRADLRQHAIAATKQRNQCAVVTASPCALVAWTRRIKYRPDPVRDFFS